MRFSEFRRTVLDQVESYFAITASKIRTIDPNYKVLYPQIAYFAECRDGYVFELCGAGDRQDISPKIVKAGSVVEFLDPFFVKERVGTPVTTLASDCTISGFSVYYANSLPKLEDLFPKHSNYYQTQLVEDLSGCPIVDLEKNASGAFVKNTLLCNSVGKFTRYRHIVFLGIFSKTVQKSEVEARFRSVLELDAVEKGISTAAHGVLTCVNGDESVFSTIQLRSSAMRRGVHETTIGEFLSKHPDIVSKAFSAGRIIHEPNLPWREHDGTVEDHFINPDMMFERPDGFYDIVDLKLANLPYPSATTGQRKRRKFCNYVATGIAQLANYSEYFRFDRNKLAAMEIYGISVHNPNCYLIVGSRETVDENELKQAMRQYTGTNMRVVDFDTLIFNALR